MREVDNPNKTFFVELTLKEVKFIREMTQNPVAREDTNSEVRKSLFVGTSRLLGYSMNDDGTIVRGSLKGGILVSS